MFRATLVLLSGIIFCLPSSSADDPGSARDSISLELIMSDPDWIGRSPQNPVWSDDGSQVYFQRKRRGSDVRDWYRLEAADKSATRLSAAEILKHVPRQGAATRDRRKVTYAQGGDLFVRDTRTGRVTQLTRTATRESSPQFLANENRIAFRRDGVLLVRDLKSGLEFEPAIIKTEDEPQEESAAKADGSFLTSKEAELFEYLQWQEALNDAAESYRKKMDAVDRTDVAEPFYVGKGQTVVSSQLAPNGRWMAVVLAKALSATQRGRQDNMPVWIRDDAYVQNRSVRRLVGDDAEAPHTIILLDLKRHRQHTIDLAELPDISTDRLAFLKSDVSEDADAAEDADETRTPRDVSIRGAEFSSDSRHLLFQCYSTDNKDRWIVTIPVGNKAAEQELTVLHHRYDEAWINWRETYATWIPSTSRVCFISEASGYAHLFLGDAKTGETRQLTEGPFEVSDPVLAHDGEAIYFRSNATHPGVYELNVVNLETADVQALTNLGGMSSFELSPDQTSAVALHSKLDQPPELFLVDLEGNAEPRRVTRTTTRKFRGIEWTVPQIVEVPSRHGRPVYSRLYLPETSDDTSTARPAVVFVHGAGYLQNAHKGWSGYFREFMFHSLLTRMGYVVLDMDYRASAGYGRDWRTAIYRQMGTPELEDLEDGVAWLTREHNVDPARVGVYGGSYGGFMTMMALFKSPDLFACGAALRPVTDWAHYNHGYTSNILNTPEIDPEAYERSSPIYFAEGLSAPLLICHGMVDDNVFFKDTVRLTQKLIELHKSDWNVAIYPVEPHGFRHPDSWYDEYRRILELFETHLK